MLTNQEIQDKYRRQAKRYDFAVQLYRLLGLHIKAYRLRAVEPLRLKRGDCVIDLGCGTGLNFPLLVERIGAGGRLIDVDLCPEMLAFARERAARSGWNNIERGFIWIRALMSICYGFNRGQYRSDANCACCF